MLEPENGFAVRVARRTMWVGDWTEDERLTVVQMALADLVPLDVLMDARALGQWFTADRVKQLLRQHAKHDDALDHVVDEYDVYDDGEAEYGSHRMRRQFEARVRQGRVSGLMGERYDGDHGNGIRPSMQDALTEMPEVRARLHPELARVLDAYTEYGNVRDAAASMGMAKSTFHRQHVKAKTEAVRILGCLEGEACDDLAA